MKPVKPVSRVASIMMGAIAFTPVFTVPAMASDDITVNPGYWNVVYPPEGGCYELYAYSNISTYVADDNAGNYRSGEEWGNFIGTVGNGLNSVGLTGCPPPPPPPPPPVYYGYYGGGDGGYGE